MIKFENTGAGFFSTVRVGEDNPRLSATSPFDGAYGAVEGIPGGMGFVIFLEDGRVSLIEGYCHGEASTEAIDFELVTFDIKPWSGARS